MLKPRTAILIPINAAPGPRTIIVRADNGYEFKQRLTFAKDYEQTLQERQRDDIIEEEVRQSQREVELVQSLYSRQTRRFNLIWLIVPLALIILIALFFFLKQRGKKVLPSVRKYIQYPPPQRQQPIRRRTVAVAPRPVIPARRTVPVRAPHFSFESVQKPVVQTAHDMPAQTAESDVSDVFHDLPKSQNAFDRLPNRDEHHVFKKLGLIGH